MSAETEQKNNNNLKLDDTFIKKAKLVIYSTEKVNNNAELIRAKSKQTKKPKLREKGKTINFWSFILVSEWESIMALSGMSNICLIEQFGRGNHDLRESGRT